MITMREGKKTTVNGVPKCQQVLISCVSADTMHRKKNKEHLVVKFSVAVELEFR